MLLFACFILFVNLTVGLELQAKLNSQWQSFKSVHGKSYTGAEEEKRKEIFKSNVQAILQHNLQADLEDVPYTLGINEFSDMDHDEFVKTMCGAKIPDNYTSGNEVMVPSERVSAPASLDWRQHNAVTKVKNQGACGSCWTFSTVGTVEGAWARKHGELVELSQQNLLDCTGPTTKYGNNGCEGGWPNEAMQYIIDNHGINSDSCYRYTGWEDMSCSYKSNCKNVQITKFVDVPKGNEKALLEAVANHGPATVCIDAGQRDFKNYKSGVYTPAYCSQKINHAVTLVGYGNEGGKDYWLVKNSWGTSWGDNGYIKMARNKGNMCGITNFAAYAVA